MIDHMRLQGCQDERKLLLAYQTYIELMEVDCLKNLSCDYDADLDITYVKENLVSSSNIYVPVHSTFSLTPSWIQNVQNKLSTSEPKSIILVTREADSTYVRHKLTIGLLPSEADCKKYRNAKLDETDNETDNHHQGNEMKVAALKPGSLKNSN